MSQQEQIAFLESELLAARRVCEMAIPRQIQVERENVTLQQHKNAYTMADCRVTPAVWPVVVAVTVAACVIWTGRGFSKVDFGGWSDDGEDMLVIVVLWWLGRGTRSC